jgi:hypothetical protein
MSEKRELLGYLTTTLEELGKLESTKPVELTMDNAGVDRMYPLYRRSSPTYTARRPVDPYVQNHHIFMIAVGIYLDSKWHELNLPDKFVLCFHREMIGPDFQIIGTVCKVRPSLMEFIPDE